MWNWKYDDMRKIWVHREADKKSRLENPRNLCRRIWTNYEKHQMITSWADERDEDEGYEMNNEWYTKQLDQSSKGSVPSVEIFF